MADLDRRRVRGGGGRERQAVSQTGMEETHPVRFGENVAVLAEVSHHCASIGDLLREFAERVGEALAADFVQLLEYAPEEDALLLRSGHGFPDSLYGRARVSAGLLSQAGRAMLDPTGSAVKLEDFSRPHEWADDHLVREHGARSGIAVKATAGGRDFGVLAVYYRTPREFLAEEETFLVRVGRLLGDGVKRLERDEEVIACRSRSEILRAGVAFLRVPAETDEVLSAAVLAAVSGGAGGSRPLADWCFADAVEADGALPKLRRVAVDHAEGAAEKLEEAFSAPLAPNAPHGSPRVYATRQGELVERIGPEFISAVARNREHRQALEEARPCSYMCVPVTGLDNFHGALGFLRVETGTPRPYEEEDLAACADFAALVGEAIDRGLPRTEIEEVQGEPRKRAAPPEVALTDPTDKERQVLDLIAEGQSIGEIKDTLYMSERTVRTHKMHLCQKLGIKPKHGAAKLIAEARRRGWISS